VSATARGYWAAIWVRRRRRSIEKLDVKALRSKLGGSSDHRRRLPRLVHCNGQENGERRAAVGSSDVVNEGHVSGLQPRDASGGSTVEGVAVVLTQLHDDHIRNMGREVPRNALGGRPAAERVRA
jgi:hypothetical protein